MKNGGRCMDKRVVAVMAMSVLFSSLAEADLPVFPICTAAGDQVQPDIDGDWIVWHDNRNGTANDDIFGYILSEPNEVPICTAAGRQRYAKVSGSIAVWQDDRDSQRDIYAFDLQNRLPLVLSGMPLGDGIQQRYPKISGSYILYEHLVDGLFNLFVYNLSAGTISPVFLSPYRQINSAIEGSIAVWMEDHGSVFQVYSCDVSRSAPATAVSPGSFAQWYPAISGSVVVWAEDRQLGTGLDIYGYDLSEGKEFSICSALGDQNYPDLSGRLVVWQDLSKGPSDSDIWAFDLNKGFLFPVAADGQNDQYPAISGRRVVWQRGISGNFDIYMAEIPQPQSIAILSPSPGQQILAGLSVPVVWQMLEGTLPGEVKIEFSADNGTNWQLIESAVPADEPYQWQTPTVDSQDCLIRVSDPTAPELAAVSGSFTIFRCSPELTADITGDCFVGLDDIAMLASQWLICGNPYNPDWCGNH